MPDYMYLLESRLSPEQRAVLLRVQELARAQESNIYLSGGAVRDMISGMALRDLDFTIEGNPVRMVRELEKGGARVVLEDEKLRHYELIFAGDVDGSLSAARDEHYPRPGAKPEIRWSSIMEDLRRRDFSINAVAISLNPASRGLLLDPTNGLADLERREIRVLSIHAFTNQPIRLLRAPRFCARMDFKMEARTQEWFDLAIERGLQETIERSELGKELMDVGREEAAAAILKEWESLELLRIINPKLQRKKPDYEGLSRLARAKEAFTSVGIRSRLKIPTVFYILRKLGPGMNTVLRNLEAPAAEAAEIIHLPNEAKKVLQILRGSKTKTARQAYEVISNTPPGLLVFIMAEFRNAKVAAKIRSYLQKWRPVRLNLPSAELESLGVPRGPKFDKILEQMFDMQLRGRGKNPEDVTRLLKRLAGIKEQPKPKEEKKKKRGKAGEPAKSKRAGGHPPEAPEESVQAANTTARASSKSDAVAKPGRKRGRPAASPKKSARLAGKRKRSSH
jgi:tRNA nucleotidyltransferase (CCA-adding enzyme)